MKIAIHIFTLYMLALTVVPCGDNGGGVVDLAKHFLGVEHSHVTSHEKHSNDCGDDDCPPFCVCSCCSSPLTTPVKSPLKVKEPKVEIVSSPIFAKEITLTAFHKSVWQPPRLS